MLTASCDNSKFVLTAMSMNGGVNVVQKKENNIRQINTRKNTTIMNSNYHFQNQIKMDFIFKNYIAICKSDMSYSKLKVLHIRTQWLFSYWILISG